MYVSFIPSSFLLILLGGGVYVKLRLLVIRKYIVCLHMYDVSYVSSLTRQEE
jgi:hypothetical protein